MRNQERYYRRYVVKLQKTVATVTHNNLKITQDFFHSSIYKPKSKFKPNNKLNMFAIIFIIHIFPPYCSFDVRDFLEK